MTHSRYMSVADNFDAYHTSTSHGTSVDPMHCIRTSLVNAVVARQHGFRKLQGPVALTFNTSYECSLHHSSAPADRFTLCLVASIRPGSFNSRIAHGNEGTSGREMIDICHTAVRNVDGKWGVNHALLSSAGRLIECSFSLIMQSTVETTDTEGTILAAIE